MFSSFRRKSETVAIRFVTFLLVGLLAFGLYACACTPQEEPVLENNTDLVIVEPEVEPVVEKEAEPAAEVWPFTGLPFAEGDDITRRPLSVKIENTPYARPQMGISRADVVYETVTEGGITRFNCIFHSDVPDHVGPVRSARNSDLSIVSQYSAILFYSGANSTVNQDLKTFGVDRMSHGQVSSLYYRVDYREAPHNLYLQLGNAFAEAANRKLETVVEKPGTLAFGETDTSSAATATHVNVPLSYSYIAEWNYDATSGRYLRSMDGPTTDVDTGEQIAARNVVVLWAPYVAGPIANGSQTYNVDLTTSGKAAVFIGGKRIDGTWQGSTDAPPRFKDASGKEILLMPGKTWFEVIDTPIGITSS